MTDVKDLYKKCQYISVNLPANKDTKESLNFDLLNLMPAGATLVNTARKEFVHEPSLLKMFAERKDFRYVTDVAPDCQEQIKTEAPNTVLCHSKKNGSTNRGSQCECRTGCCQADREFPYQRR